MKRLVAGALGAALLAVSSVGPASAAHRGAIVDCGSAGSFDVRATANNAGFDVPPPHGVLLFEGRASLTILTLFIAGSPVYERATVGAEHNNVNEVTCSFSLPNGIPIVVTGILRT